MELFKKYKKLKTFLGYELRKINFFHNDKSEVNKTCLLNLKKNKVVVINDFVSRENCKKIISHLDMMFENKNTPMWKDKEESDMRIFGAEKTFEEIEIFSKIIS